jgi:hypothetical protein
MSTQKTISLPEGYIQFAKDTGQGVTAVAREQLDTWIEDEEVNPPESGTRDRDGEKRRTTIRLSSRHIDFIDSNNVNLSRGIREHLVGRIDKERRLQKQEDTPNETTPEGSRALIAIVSKSQNTTWATERIQWEWVQWYLTGEIPHREQAKRSRPR